MQILQEMAAHLTLQMTDPPGPVLCELAVAMKTEWIANPSSAAAFCGYSCLHLHLFMQAQNELKDAIQYRPKL